MTSYEKLVRFLEEHRGKGMTVCFGGVVNIDTWVTPGWGFNEKDGRLHIESENEYSFGISIDDIADFVIDSLNTNLVFKDGSMLDFLV